MLAESSISGIPSLQAVPPSDKGVNSFTANVADRRRHIRLPTSPIGDLDPLP